MREADELLRSSYAYDLPKELIAQDPIAKRSDSRLMVVDRKSGATEHSIFSNIISLFNKGDCLVLNNTRVIPARLYGTRDTGASVELLLLKRLSDNRWEALVRPGKKCRVGAKLSFGEGELLAEVEEVLPGGNRLVHFTYDGIFEEVLDRLGQMPLPPYITHTLEDKERYQTVYAKYDGSAAAPTAGLHFTKELLAAIEKKGVRIAEVTLHVGLGTFRPVKEDCILDHAMHEEYYQISQEAADIINETKLAGGRVIAVGTTATRTLEAAYAKLHDLSGVEVDGRGDGKPAGRVPAVLADGSDGLAERIWVAPTSATTDIFIYPGYTFKVIDGLITNFHLPESTLIMLVSALTGREHVLKAYEEAVKNRYRFFSFGDAMLIL